MQNLKAFALTCFHTRIKYRKANSRKIDVNFLKIRIVFIFLNAIRKAKYRFPMNTNT